MTIEFFDALCILLCCLFLIKARPVVFGIASR
jgi:hypothetical protein